MNPKPGPRTATSEPELLAAFVCVLELEEQALVDGDPDAIASFAREKAAYLDRLAALPPSRDPTPAVRALRESALLANERNGRLIAMRLARVQQRLDALTGRQEAGAAYDADGFARPHGPAHASQRSIG